MKKFVSIVLLIAMCCTFMIGCGATEQAPSAPAADAPAADAPANDAPAAEGGEITGIGDAKGSGNVALEGTELKAFIRAAKPHEAGSKNGQFSMRGSTIISDINDKHNTQG